MPIYDDHMVQNTVYRCIMELIGIDITGIGIVFGIWYWSRNWNGIVLSEL